LPVEGLNRGGEVLGGEGFGSKEERTKGKFARKGSREKRLTLNWCTEIGNVRCGWEMRRKREGSGSRASSYGKKRNEVAEKDGKVSKREDIGTHNLKRNTLGGKEFWGRGIKSEGLAGEIWGERKKKKSRTVRSPD